MSSFNNEFVITPFADFSTTNPNGKRYVTTIENAKDNVYITEFRKNKYSPFPNEGGKFNITNEQRDNLSFNFNEGVDDEYIKKYGNNSKNDKKTIELLNKFTNEYNRQKDNIFINNKSKAKKGKLVSDNYFFMPLLKDNNDEGETDKSITFRSSFFKKFTLYYKGTKLDEANKKIINNVLFPKGGKPKKGDEFKKHKETSTFNIYWPQGSQEKILVPYSDLEEKKEFKVDVIYREVETDEDIKKPNEFTNENLDKQEVLEEFNSLYGEPKMMTIETPQELEKYCKSAYYRIGFTVPEFWVEANPSAKGKLMDCGFKAYCVCIDIVNIKTKYENMGTSKKSVVNMMYKNMAFDNKKASIANKEESSSKSSEETNSDEEEEFEEVEVSDDESVEEEIVIKKPTNKK